jgi:hypothetical protein
MGITAIGRACLLLLVIPPIRAGDYPVVTVCEVLHGLPFYNGKTLIVVGKKSAGTEGSWLSQDCPTNLVSDGVEWGSAISLTYVADTNKTAPTLPKDFKWDKEGVMSKLNKVKATTKLTALDQGEYIYEDQWVAVFGRLETKVSLETYVNRVGQRMRQGFGHEGDSPAQLVWPEGGIHGFPSSGWRLSRKPISNVAAPYRSLQRTLWPRIKAVLTSDDGSAYFESSMKDALVPDGAEGVGRFKGTVISSSPALWPDTIVLAVSGGNTPEVALKLDRPWKIDIPSGAKIEFEGVAVAYTRSPFMVTFAVTATQLSIALTQ